MKLLLKTTTYVLASCVTALSLSACDDPQRSERADIDEGDDEDSGDDMPDVEFDEDAVIIEAKEFASRLTQLSEMAEQEETHADAAAVVVWGSPEVSEMFASINPDDPTQELTFPVGAMFVKEHLDEAGATRGFTMMYKAEPGYDSVGGDWFWARVDGDNVSDSGRVQWCSSCHAAAINTDFVLGFGKSP